MKVRGVLLKAEGLLPFNADVWTSFVAQLSATGKNTKNDYC